MQTLVLLDDRHGRSSTCSTVLQDLAGATERRNRGREMGTGEAGVLMGTVAGVGVDSAPLGASMARIPSRLFQPVTQHDFAHPAEKDLARILSFYRIRWVYEPTTFHLEFRDDGRPAEQITPDFYLPDHDLYIELTTMRQRLVTRKNRKIRRLRETFPSIHIKLLYRRDYDRLIGAYPAPDHIAEPELGPVLFDTEAIQLRIRELARDISESTISWHRSYGRSAARVAGAASPDRDRIWSPAGSRRSGPGARSARMLRHPRSPATLPLWIRRR
jgi:hypothetical protein